VARRLPLALALLVLTAAGPCTTPTASLTVLPNPAQTGQRVTFDASATKDASRFIFYPGVGEKCFNPEGERCQDQRDPIFTHVYDSPGIYTVTLTAREEGLRLSGDRWFQTDVASQTLTVTDPTLPTPGFVMDPNPACSKGVVGFDASSSADPGGIARYEWDLDGDGTFETDTGTDPTATSQNYGVSPAKRNVALRVTDGDGNTAELKHPLVIDDTLCRPAPAARVSVAGAGNKTRFALSMVPTLRRRGFGMANGNHYTISGLRARGTVKLSGLPAPLQRVRRARWVADLSATLNMRTKRLVVQGEALLDLGRRGRLCTGIVVDRRKGIRTQGRMQVLGGSGHAGHIDGSAAYRGELGRKGQMMVSGQMQMKSVKSRGLTRACRQLLPSH
jgi:hypothetical protein